MENATNFPKQLAELLVNGAQLGLALSFLPLSPSSSVALLINLLL